MVQSKLHPGARWQFRIGGYFLFVIIGAFIFSWTAFPLMMLFTTKETTFSFILFSLFILFVIIASEIYARLSYNRWFYEFTDEGLRLERGIIWKRYSNIPYERIQNVDINRGIFARLLGFSTLMIQTAGYSYQRRAEGVIPAVDMKVAEKLRAFVMKKITHKQSRSGL